jgi:hypothetical protein
MPDFRALEQNIQSDTFKTIFSIIADNQPDNKIIGDSAEAVCLGPSEIEQIQRLMVQKVFSDRAVDGPINSYQETKNGIIRAAADLVADSYFNPVTGVGTLIDPGTYNQASTPVSISPMDATAEYSSGGITSVIIDKKAEGFLINGYRFENKNWPKASLSRLKDYCDKFSFVQSLKDSERDGLLFGGSLLVPHLKYDSPYTYEMTIDELIKNGILTKDSLSYFWEADRWNLVLIPDYNISSKNYLHPDKIYCPITGLTVNTTKGKGRGMINRPNRLPYWGTIRQMGWGISELERWIKSVLAYEVSIMGLPIMLQQMSLMYRTIPLDQLAAQNGANAARALAQELSKNMATMSNVAPRTINDVGELKVIERHFTDYDKLIMLLKQDVGAKACISESVIFHSESTGFSDNEGETTLKQAETFQRLGNLAKEDLQPVLKVLVASCFGPDSLEYQGIQGLQIFFDSPAVLTNQDRAAAGQTFATVSSSAFSMGMEIGDSLQIGKVFVPDIEIPEEIIEKYSNQVEPDEMGLPDMGRALNEIMARIQNPVAEGVGTPTKRIIEKLDSGKPVNKLSDRIKGLFRKIVGDADFNESDHPRKSNGEFGQGGGESESKTKKQKPIRKPNKDKEIKKP